MKLIENGRRKLANLRNTLPLALLALVASGGAMAQSTATTDIIAAINAGKADAILVAIAVVVALWSIYGVYMMRRKG